MNLVDNPRSRVFPILLIETHAHEAKWSQILKESFNMRACIAQYNVTRVL